MRELGAPIEHDPFAVNATGAAGAGAAGIGIARARSMRDGGGYAAALAMGDGQSPYPAFAGPGSMQHHEMYNVPPGAPGGAPYRGPGSPEFDLLEAAGMGAGAAAAAGVARGPSMHNRAVQQADYSALARNKSQGARSLADPVLSGSSTEYTSPQSESYASHYQPGFRGDSGGGGYAPQEVQPGGGVAGSGGGPDPYGGYTPSHDLGLTSGTTSGSLVSPGSLPNPYSASTTQSGMPGDEVGSGYMESDGEEEEEEGRRVLKVGFLIYVVFILSSMADTGVGFRSRMNSHIPFGFTNPLDLELFFFWSSFSRRLKNCFFVYSRGVLRSFAFSGPFTHFI